MSAGGGTGGSPGRCSPGGAVNAHLETIALAAGDLVSWCEADVSANGPIDLTQVSMRYALHALGHTVFGDDIVHAAPTLRSVLPALGDHLKKRSLAPVRSPHSWPTPANRRAEAIRKVVWDLADELIAARRARGVGEKDLLSRLLDARDPETGDALSDDDVRDEAIIFLIAGHETTGSALAFTLRLLGRYEDVQERARAEVLDLTRRQPGGPCEIEQLPYVAQGRCCIPGQYPATRHTSSMRSRHDLRSPVPVPSSAFVGFRFPPEVILLAVRWYLRFGLSYRDVEELLAERGVEVDHVSVYRWVQRFTPLLADAARPCRHPVGDRWHVDETYLKVAGTWRYLYRAIDQFGQVVDVLLSSQRDAGAARRFFTKAMADTQSEPAEVVTDRARAYLSVLDELLPGTFHDVERYANNVLEADHGRLKCRLRPMRGLKTMASVQIVCSGHAFVQNLQRGHYELAVDVPARRRLARAFVELALTI